MKMHIKLFYLLIFDFEFHVHVLHMISMYILYSLTVMHITAYLVFSLFAIKTPSSVHLNKEKSSHLQLHSGINFHNKNKIFQKNVTEIN